MLCSRASGTLRESIDDLADAAVSTHVIGAAADVVELDAKQAIKQGTELAARL